MEALCSLPGDFGLMEQLKLNILKFPNYQNFRAEIRRASDHVNLVLRGQLRVLR